MIRVTFYISILCIVMVFVSACNQNSDEEGQLRHSLKELQKQLEARRVENVRDKLDNDFLAQGLYGTPQLAQMMVLHFKQNKQIYLFLENTEIQMDYPKADVVTTAYLLGAKNIIPQRGQRYGVKMRWIKVNSEWKLSRINWQRDIDN